MEDSKRVKRLLREIEEMRKSDRLSVRFHLAIVALTVIGVAIIHLR